MGEDIKEGGITVWMVLLFLSNGVCELSSALE